MPTRREVVETYYGKGERNKSRTAKILGVSRSSVREHLDRHEAEIGQEAETQKDKHKQRISDLENLVEQQRAHISRLRDARKFSLPKLGKKRKSKGDSFTRVIIPDTHGCRADKDALSACLEDVARINPSEVVLLGDHLDCSGFLSAHFTLGFISECQYTFEEDVSAANTFLDELQKAAPNAEIHYLEGNHEHRIRKFCITSALRNPKDAKYLHDLLSVPVLLHLEDRKITFYEQGVFYGGINIPSTIKLGHSYYTHGISASKNAAKIHAERFAGNICFGHIHRSQTYSTRTVGSGIISAFCPGCLCELQPMYLHASVSDWTHGFAVALCQADGSFLHIQCPIINGKSYFSELTERLG